MILRQCRTKVLLYCYHLTLHLLLLTVSDAETQKFLIPTANSKQFLMAYRSEREDQSSEVANQENNWEDHTNILFFISVNLT